MNKRMENGERIAIHWSTEHQFQEHEPMTFSLVEAAGGAVEVTRVFSEGTRIIIEWSPLDPSGTLVPAPDWRKAQTPEADLCPTCKAPIRWREDGEWLAGDCYCGHPSAMMAKPRTAKPQGTPE